jgi:hypothetical protein
MPVQCSWRLCIAAFPPSPAPCLHSTHPPKPFLLEVASSMTLPLAAMPSIPADAPGAARGLPAASRKSTILGFLETRPVQWENLHTNSADAAFLTRAICRWHSLSRDTAKLPNGQSGLYPARCLMAVPLLVHRLFEFNGVCSEGQNSRRESWASKQR